MVDFFFTPTKTNSTQFQPNGVYFGIVKRVDESINRVWVEIPRISPNFEYGPLSVVGEILPAVNDRVACIFVENSTENLVVIGKFLSVSEVTESSVTVIGDSLSPITIRSISGTLYRSAKFTIQATRGSNYLLTEILAIHDGTTASFTEYGRVVVGTAPATFDVDFVSGNLVLEAIQTTTTATTYKVKTSAFAV